MVDRLFCKLQVCVIWEGRTLSFELFIWAVTEYIKFSAQRRLVSPLMTYTQVKEMFEYPFDDNSMFGLNFEGDY